MITNIESHISAFNWYENHRPHMTLNEHSHYAIQIMRLSKLIMEIWKKIDPYILSAAKM